MVKEWCRAKNPAESGFWSLSFFLVRPQHEPEPEQPGQTCPAFRLRFGREGQGCLFRGDFLNLMLLALEAVLPFDLLNLADDFCFPLFNKTNLLQQFSKFMGKNGGFNATLVQLHQRVIQAMGLGGFLKA